MKRKLFSVAMAFGGVLFILLSCGKNNPSPSGNTTSGTPSGNNTSSCYITSAYANGVEENAFFYDSQNRCVKLIDYNPNGKIMDSTLLSYDANGRISKATVYVPSSSYITYNVYKYNSDNTIAADSGYAIYDNTTYQYGYDVYTYNSSKQVTQISNYVSNTLSTTPTFAMDSSTTYTYDANGNVATTKAYNSSGILQETITYTFDNAISYTYGLSVDPLSPELSSKNNVLTASAVDGSGNAVASDSYTITYTYNSNNYPVSGVTKYQNSTSQTATINYNCQ